VPVPFWGNEMCSLSGATIERLNSTDPTISKSASFALKEYPVLFPRFRKTVVS